MFCAVWQPLYELSEQGQALKKAVRKHRQNSVKLPALAKRCFDYCRSV